MEPIIILLFNIITCRPGILLDFRLSDSRGGLRRQFAFQSIPAIFLLCHYFVYLKFKNLPIPDYLIISISFSISNCIFGWLFFSRLKEAIIDFRQLFKKVFLVKKFYLLIGEVIGRPFLFSLSAIVIPQNNIFLNFSLVWLILELAGAVGFSLILILFYYRKFSFAQSI